MNKETIQNKLKEIQTQKDELYKTIEELDAQRVQLVANLNAFQGAEQVLQQLIEEDKAE